MVKPDGVQRAKIGKIIETFEKRGFKLLGMKIMQASKELLEEHYKDLKGRPYYPRLMDYMSKGPVLAMVWEGDNVIVTGRKIMGATNPLEQQPGTIRFNNSISNNNTIHGSDTKEAAAKEIALWFKPGEITKWDSHSQKWVYE